MIDIQPYIDKLEKLKYGLSHYVDELAYSYKWHLVIISDTKIEFPKYYEMVDHDSNIEIQSYQWYEQPNKGWSRPDKVFGNVELRYLWKQFKPKSINMS